MKAKDVLGLAKDRGAVMVDLKFMDFPGLWQHFTIPVDELDEDIFEDGLGFDGSSHPRLAGDQRVRHARHPATRHGVHRSVHAGRRRCR